MKKIWIICLCIVFDLSAQNQTSQTFQQLYALTGGTWLMKTAKGDLYEQWKKINNSLLRNHSFKINGKDTLWLEQVELGLRNNEINYTSTVANENNGKAIPFKLVESNNNQFMFVNPEHDFPQRIVYHLISKDSLHAWIDGSFNGKISRKDFYYKRVK